VGDIIPAMFLAYGIMVACWNVQRTGRGQFLDVAMVDSILAICERIVFQYSATGETPLPEGNGHPLHCPFGLFPAKDGHVSLGVPNDRFWKPLTELMGRPELALDTRFLTRRDRIEHRAEVDALVGDWTLQHTKRELSEMLGGRIPFGPVFNASDIFADAHFRDRSMLVDVEMPGLVQPLTIAGTPVHMSETPGGVYRRAPLTGEHTDSVLHDFGFSKDEIASLRVAGAVSPSATYLQGL
jgi:formyl-CoA transferase